MNFKADRNRVAGSFTVVDYGSSTNYLQVKLSATVDSKHLTIQQCRARQNNHIVSDIYPHNFTITRSFSRSITHLHTEYSYLRGPSDTEGKFKLRRIGLPTDNTSIPNLANIVLRRRDIEVEEKVGDLGPPM